MIHDPCFIARSALWEQAQFKICLLCTRKTFVGELFGFGVVVVLLKLSIIYSQLEIPAHNKNLQPRAMRHGPCITHLN